MYISYSSSDEYCEYTGISIISLFENNKDLDLCVFLIDNGISTNNKDYIINISEKYNRKIEFIDGNIIEQELKNKVPMFNGSFSTYSRIILDKIYPEYVDKILVLDSDTIVNGTLDSLNDLEFNGKIIAAVENPEFYLNENINTEEKKIIKLKKKYFNAGILYVNLKEWREKNFSKKIDKAISELVDYKFVDQTILNYATDQEDYIKLPYKYNYWGHLWNKADKQRIHSYFNNFFSKEEIEDAETNPIIIHYKGYDSRPWYKESTSLMKDKYLYYKNISPWKDSKLESFYDSSYYRKLPFLNKLKMRVVIALNNTVILEKLKKIYRAIKLDKE